MELSELNQRLTKEMDLVRKPIKSDLKSCKKSDLPRMD